MRRAKVVRPGALGALPRRGAVGVVGLVFVYVQCVFVVGAEVVVDDFGAVRGPVAVAPRGGPAKEPFVHDVHGV